MISQVKQEIAPKGVLHVALNFGNPVLVQHALASGQAQGVTVDLAHEIARELDLELVFHEFDSAGKVSQVASQGVWDLAFLAIDPKRAEEIAFTAPYVIIEGSYVVHQDSVLQTIDEFDQEHINIAVGLGTAYELFLSRSLQHANLIKVETSKAALAYLLSHPDHAAAGVRQPLEAFCHEHPDFRVIPGRFTAIEQAIGVPQGRPNASAFLNDFISRQKKNGFVLDALKRSHQTAASVAP